MELIANSSKLYIVKFSSIYHGVTFSIEIEYVDNQIRFLPFIDVSYSSSSTFEISSFLQLIESMPQDDFKRKIEFSFGK